MKGKIEAMDNQNSPVEGGFYLFVSIAVVFVALYMIVAFALLRFTGPAQVYAGHRTVDVAAMFLARRLKGIHWAPGEIMAFVSSGVLFAAAITGVIVMYCRLHKSHQMMGRRFASDQGSAEWSSPLALKHLCGQDGIILGYDPQPPHMPVRLSMRASCEHVMIVGPTGCGKSANCFIPNLLFLPPGVSAIVTDPKGELYSVTSGELRRRGVNTVVFNPMDPGSSAYYNPLELARNESELSDIAEMTMRNGFISAPGQTGNAEWVNHSMSLWEAAIHMSKALGERSDNEDPDISSLQGALSIVRNYDDQGMLGLAELIGGASLEKYKDYAQCLSSPQTAGSIRMMVMSSTRTFSRSDIREVMISRGGRQGIDPSSLRRRPTVLYVQIPERKSTILMPVMATLFWQLMEHLLSEPGLPIVILADEFANIGKIPDLAQLVATIRSRGISLVAGIQDFVQFARVYTEKEQTDISNSLRTKVFFPGLTGESLRFVSEMSGYSSIRTYSETGRPGIFGLNDQSASTQVQRRELLTPDEVRRLPEGKVLVLAHNLNPVLLDSVPYFRLRQFRHLYNPDKARSTA